MRSSCAILLALLALSIASCGSGVTAVFEHRVLKPDGETLYLEELESVASDPEKDEEDLRDLGIEDDLLISTLIDYYQ